MKNSNQKKHGFMSLINNFLKIEKEKIFKCKKCKETFDSNELKNLFYICPNCESYIQMPARERIDSILDSGYKIIKHNSKIINPLKIKGYEEKVKEFQKKTKEEENVVSAIGNINDQKVYLMCMDSYFFMGSMGYETGEIITQGFEYAIKKNLPVIIFCASGGARMQEGTISLMQMAKTVNILTKFKNLYISIFTDPTMGGVSASFASLGDIVIAEKNSRIGFAGRKVIEGTINKELPKDFQGDTFTKEHGFADMIVKRQDMKNTLSKLLSLHC